MFLDTLRQKIGRSVTADFREFEKHYRSSRLSLIQNQPKSTMMLPFQSVKFDYMCATAWNSFTLH